MKEKLSLKPYLRTEIRIQEDSGKVSQIKADLINAEITDIYHFDKKPRITSIIATGNWQGEQREHYTLIRTADGDIYLLTPEEQIWELEREQICIHLDVANREALGDRDAYWEKAIEHINKWVDAIWIISTRGMKKHIKPSIMEMKNHTIKSRIDDESMKAGRPIEEIYLEGPTYKGIKPIGSLKVTSKILAILPNPEDRIEMEEFVKDPQTRGINGYLGSVTQEIDIVDDISQVENTSYYNYILSKGQENMPTTRTSRDYVKFGGTGIDLLVVWIFALNTTGEFNPGILNIED